MDDTIADDARIPSAATRWIVADDDRILTDKELDEMTTTSATTRWRERKAGRWPPLLDISPGRKGQTLGQIRQMIAQRRAEAEARANAAQEPRRPGRPRKITDEIPTKAI